MYSHVFIKSIFTFPLCHSDIHGVNEFLCLIYFFESKFSIVVIHVLSITFHCFIRFRKWKWTLPKMSWDWFWSRFMGDLRGNIMHDILFISETAIFKIYVCYYCLFRFSAFSDILEHFTKTNTAGNVWFSEFSAFVKFAEFRFYKILPLL